MSVTSTIRNRWRLFVAGYVLLLAAVTLMPQPIVEQLTSAEIRGSSRLIHLVLFIPLGFGAGMTRLGAKPLFRACLHPFIWSSLYGILLELLQGLLTGLQRSASLHDMAANVLGTLAGVTSAGIWQAATSSHGLFPKPPPTHQERPHG